MKLSWIETILGAGFGVPDQNINSICIDSRHVRSGDVFFAIVGENHNAHKFVDEVLAKGAFCVVSDTARTGCLCVKDTVSALGLLAKEWRKKCHPKVLAITGSCGKTTVKEMSAAILRRAFGADCVLATSGNLNNQLGVPMTLLKLTSSHRFAVVEAGMNHFGELSYLTDIIAPDIALVNNALRAHIGCGFEDTKDIARAKSEIYTGLNNNGIAIWNADSDQADIFQEAAGRFSVRRFALKQGEVFAQNIVQTALSSQFDLLTPQGKVAVYLPAPGEHNIRNACAAAALCMDDASLEEIAQGLKDYQPAGSRLRIAQTMQGGTLIDDVYNANPDSMRAAIDVLASFDAPRLLIMGQMGELGEAAAQLHIEVAHYALEKGIEMALFLGDFAPLCAQAFGDKQSAFADKSSLIKKAQNIIQKNTTVLVKGSRFMKMEEVVRVLENLS